MILGSQSELPGPEGPGWWTGATVDHTGGCRGAEVGAVVASEVYGRAGAMHSKGRGSGRGDQALG